LDTRHPALSRIGKKAEWRCERCGGPHEISAAEAESLRRAIRALAQAGLVEVEHYPVLRARLPVTADEKKREAKEAAELQQQVDSLVKLLNRHRRRRRRS
jgi:hypothetical protein